MRHRVRETEESLLVTPAIEGEPVKGAMTVSIPFVVAGLITLISGVAIAYFNRASVDSGGGECLNKVS